MLAFLIFQGAQCSHENKLEEAYNDAEAVKDYLEGLVDAAESVDVEYARLSVYYDLLWAANSRFFDARSELARYRQSRWWNQGGGPVEPSR